MTKFIIPTSIMLLQQPQQPQPPQVQSQTTPPHSPPSSSSSSSTMMTATSSDAPILPLLRCLGIAHTLRLLSATLCERRIIFLSSSTSKLTTCIHALSSILSQGCLSWQHVYVPILPPTMLNFLAAPMPYIIGLLHPPYGSVQQLERISGLGEVLAVYLDSNEFKTFGISNPDMSIPDILSSEYQLNYGNNSSGGMDPMASPYGYAGYTSSSSSNPYHSQNPTTIPSSSSQPSPYHHPQQPQPSQTQYYSIADILKMDLITILKEDKKSRTTGSGNGTLSGVGGGSMANAAVKGKDLLKKGLGKLKNITKKVSTAGTGMALEPSRSNDYNTEYDYQQSSSHHGTGGNAGGGGGGNTGDGSGGIDPPGNESAISDPIKNNDLYTYNDGYNNESWEEEVRIAFTVFFLSYIGDMKQYLRPKAKGVGGPPTFDKELFKSSRIQTAGEYENSPMYKMTIHFKESQLFEQFVHARVEDISQRRSFSPRISPLFVLALQYHNSKRIPFRSNDIRAVVKSMARNRPVQDLIHGISHVRSKAIALTSNSRNEATAQSTLHRLVMECRECSIILVEVMSVVWDRLRDSRGMQWKHGLYALQIIQELLLHGPLAAVTEVTDGLDKIRRMMKGYDNMRTVAVQEIRSLARFVYTLIIHRSRLFAMRKICAERRNMLLHPVRYVRDSRFDIVSNRRMRLSLVKFKKLHALIKPGNVVGGSKSSGGGGGVDLLGTVETTSVPTNPSSAAVGLEQLLQSTPTTAAAASSTTTTTPGLAGAAQPPPFNVATSQTQMTQGTPQVLASSPPSHQDSLLDRMGNATISQQQPSQAPPIQQTIPPTAVTNSPTHGGSSSSSFPLPQQQHQASTAMTGQMLNQPGFVQQSNVVPNTTQNFAALPPQQQSFQGAPVAAVPFANQMQQQQQQPQPSYLNTQNLQAVQQINQMGLQNQSSAPTSPTTKSKPSLQFDPFA